MIRTSESIKSIALALLKFQGEVDGVGKTKKNPAFKSNYATFENVRDTAVPELQAVGVVFIQSAGGIVENVMSMTTRLIHVESGEWIEGVMDIPLGKKDPQGMGSAQTYAQRYQLMAMLGLPAVDDDGEGAKDDPARSAEKPRDETQRNVGVTVPSEIKPPTEAQRKAQWALLMDDLLVEAKKGSVAIEAYMKHPETESELAKLGKWASNFRDEAKQIYRLTKATEDNFGAAPKQIVPPSFEHLQPSNSVGELLDQLDLNSQEQERE